MTYLPGMDHTAAENVVTVVAACLDGDLDRIDAALRNVAGSEVPVGATQLTLALGLMSAK